jgi:hypothetical protein
MRRAFIGSGALTFGLGGREPVGDGTDLDDEALIGKASATALHSRGSVNVFFHSLNGEFEATAIERSSSLAVKIWNISLLPMRSRLR